MLSKHVQVKEIRVFHSIIDFSCAYKDIYVKKVFETEKCQSDPTNTFLDLKSVYCENLKEWKGIPPNQYSSF